MITDRAETVLVIAAHPDDAAIGCGGSIARHVAHDAAVTVAYATAGEMGRADEPPEAVAETRRREAGAAADELGVADVAFLGQPDGGVTFDRSALRSYVSLLREQHPDVVYLPHSDDADHDHEVVSSLAVEGLRKAYAPTFPGCGPVPERAPTVALEYELWTPLTDPAVFHAIDDVLDCKERAIRCHESQVELVDYAEAALGLNRYRGAMHGTSEYAEAFRVRRVETSGGTAVA